MAQTAQSAGIPLLLWPIVLLWRLVTFVCNLTGILLAIALGLALMALGLLFSISVVGAVVGIPLFILGLFLLARGVF